jgi:hypothetical protein
MTEAQFLVLAACIWFAPHVPKELAFINGGIMAITAVSIGMGWIT